MAEPELWLIRHGETEWSRAGRHTGVTEVPLTPAGEDQARRLGEVLAGLRFDRVLCSPRLRARHTAELAGLLPFEVVDDLREWDYGEFEGQTTADIQDGIPGWSIWDGPWNGGETADSVGARADRVVDELLASGAQRVALVGHGHFSRVLAARWAGAPPSAGRWLYLDTATISALGWDRHGPVVLRWNLPASWVAAAEA